MKLDRSLQFRLLQECRNAYPGALEDKNEIRDPDVNANLIYLYEHELIVGTLVNGNVEIRRPQITAKGLDFLEDDGGISAILGTITVKIDRDDLRSLIAAHVEASDLPVEEKGALSDAMRSLSAQALRELVSVCRKTPFLEFEPASAVKFDPDLSGGFRVKWTWSATFGGKRRAGGDFGAHIGDFWKYRAWRAAGSPVRAALARFPGNVRQLFVAGT